MLLMAGWGCLDRESHTRARGWGEIQEGIGLSKKY